MSDRIEEVGQVPLAQWESSAQAAVPAPAPVAANDAAANDAAGESSPAPRKQRRGFAAMDPSRQREIASRGGKASHSKGTGHEWDREAAREAGRKGGIATREVRSRAKREG